MAPELVAVRREIHRYPELSFEEERTSRLVVRELAGLGLELEESFGGSTAVVAILRRGSSRGSPRNLVLRADMDALDIQEESGLPFASERPGLMHACGHDAHTAALIGAARLLSRHRDELEGEVRFVFQPGEEDGRGARFLIERGLLDDPPADGAFAQHADPGLPAGRISVREGTVFASGAGFALRVQGKGGHPGLPHQTVDAIVVAAQIVQALQLLASRQADPRKPFTLGIGTIRGGTRANVIADSAELTGTMRAFDSEIVEWAAEGIERIASRTAEAFGASCRTETRLGGLPLVNDPAMVTLARGAVGAAIGKDRLTAGTPILAGEDFALFAEKVPSAMLMLGVGHRGRENFPLHHPRFDIDEAAVPVGAAALASCALAFLAPGNTQGGLS